MRIGKILSKKFLMSFVCVLFTAIVSLCGANILNTYLLDTTNSGYQETINDDNQNENTGSNNGSSDDDSENNDGNDEDTKVETSGYWSDRAQKPGLYTNAPYNSKDNPYVVKTPAQLAYILREPSAYYFITGSFDMSAHFWNSNNISFSGGINAGIVSNKQPANIYNLTFEGNNSDDPSYFLSRASGSSESDKAVINNLIVEIENGGGFIDTVAYTEITNCANISTKTYALGGIVSSITYSTVRGCMNLANISAEWDKRGQGGIVGYSSSGTNTIEDCVNYGSVKGKGDIGGIVGKSTNGTLTINRCINDGLLYAKDRGKSVGGLVGAITGGSGNIQNSINASAFITTANHICAILGYTQVKVRLGEVYSVRNYGSDLWDMYFENGGFWGINKGDVDEFGRLVFSNSAASNRNDILLYMSAFGFSVSSDTSSTWTSSVVYNYFYSSISSPIVALSNFVSSVSIGVQYQMPDGKGGYEYKYHYDSNGYRISLYRSSYGYFTETNLTTYYYLRNSAEKALFYVQGSSSTYTYVGVFSDTQESAIPISTSTTFTTELTNSYYTFIVRFRATRVSLTFSSYYINDFIEDYSPEKRLDLMELGTEGGYLYSYDADIYVNNIYTQDTIPVINSNQDATFSTGELEYRRRIKLEIHINDGYEFFGIFRRDKLDSLNRLYYYDKIDDGINFYASVKPGDTIGNTLTYQFNIDNLQTGLFETNYVLVFLRYQYEFDLRVRNVIQTGSSLSTTNPTTEDGYYGYANRVYNRPDSQFGTDFSSNLKELDLEKLVIAEGNDFFDGEYCYYVGYVTTNEPNIDNLSFWWGGVRSFGFVYNEEFTDANGNGIYDESETFIDSNGNGEYDTDLLVGSGEKLPSGVSGNALMKYNDQNNNKQITINLQDLFGTTKTERLNITTDNNVEITIKKYVVDTDNDYLHSSERDGNSTSATVDDEDNSVGGKFVTYTYYITDVYDSSIDTDNKYLFGQIGGETGVSIGVDYPENTNENDEYSESSAYYVAKLSTVYVTVKNDNGILTFTEVTENTEGAVKVNKLQFTLFLFYDFDFDESRPLSSSFDETKMGPKDIEKEGDNFTGGDFYLNEIFTITKTPIEGYYANGGDYTFHKNSNESNKEFLDDAQVTNINNYKNEDFEKPVSSSEEGSESVSALADTSNNIKNLYELADSSSNNKTIILISYYSLEVVELTINLSGLGETSDVRNLKFRISINGNELYDNLTDTPLTNREEFSNYTIKSYSMVEIEVSPYGAMAGANSNSVYKFGDISLDGATLSELPQTTFQVISSNNNEEKETVNLTVNYESVKDGITNTLKRKGGYYIIDELNDLYYMLYNVIYNNATYAGYKFKQTCDLDFGNNEFLPIGYQYTPFKGSYDGQYYSIKNLTIDAGNLSNVGLFGYVENATIKNLNFVGGSITGFNNVGVIGCAENSTITRVNNYSCTINYSDNITLNHIFVTDTIKETLNEPYTDSNGNGQYNEGEPYEDINGDGKCGTYNIYNVKALTSETGYNENLLLRVKADGFNDFTFSVGGTDSYAFSTVNSAYNVGGLLGNVTGSSVSVSSSKGTVGQETADATEETELDVSADDSTVKSISDEIKNRNIAGFVGYVSGGTISNCYTSQNTFDGTTENSSLTCCHYNISDITDLTDCDCESKFNW